MTLDDFRELRFYAGRILSKHIYKISSCAGKSAFRSFEQAMGTIRQDKRREVKAFHCAACGLFHVGSNIAGNKKRKHEKRIKRGY